MFLGNPLSKLIEKNKPSIGIIGFCIVDGSKWTMGFRGTAFCVTQSYFISALHIYNGMSEEEKRNLKIWILDPSDPLNYVMCDAEFLDKDIMNDCAIIKLLRPSEEINIGKDQSIKPLIMANSDKVKEGKKVFFSGFPESTMNLSEVRREVSFVSIHAIIGAIKRNTETKKTMLFYLDTNCDKGFSGSPLFSLKTGKIIGFITGRFAKPIDEKQQRYEIVGLGIARPINPVKEFLEQINQKVGKLIK